MQSFRVELLKLDPRLPVIGGTCSVWSLSWQVLPGSLALFKGYIYIAMISDICYMAKCPKEVGPCSGKVQLLASGLLLASTACERAVRGGVWVDL